MLGRIIWNPYGALILGLLALAAGIGALTGLNIACETKTTALAEGETCKGRTGDTLSFAEWQSQQNSVTIFLLVFGGLLVVGGAFFLNRRRKRRAAEAAAA